MTLAHFALLLPALAFLPMAAPAQDAVPVKPPTLAAALAAVKPPDLGRRLVRVVGRPSEAAPSPP